MLIKYLDAMIAAHKLLGDYRNDPGSITNKARQVDPVIHDLRVAIYELEQNLKEIQHEKADRTSNGN
jgi:hypothetical protein